MRKIALGLLGFGMAGCSAGGDDVRGVDHEETLLSVSATGQAETRPDEAGFLAGVNSWATSAGAASEANISDMAKVVAALRSTGIADDDIQTRTVSVQRIDWGDRKGQFQASNTVAVTVRDIDKAGEAVTAATEAGANIVSGPDLRMSDPEAAANAAYTSAYKAARTRAQAYADAADMTINRVLYIRDAGGAQGNRYLAGAIPVAPPPPPVAPAYARQTSARVESADESGRIMAGQTSSAVTVQVDFALVPK